MPSIGLPHLFLYDWFSFSSMSFRHRTTMPIPAATASLSLSITWLSTRANLSGCHRRNAARILSFDEISGECANDNRNSRIASRRNSDSGRLRDVPESRRGASATTGHGIRSNVSALSRPSSGCRWLSSAHRASYVRHALATSRALRRVRSWRRRSSSRSLSSCRRCCVRRRASSVAMRCASTRRASSRRRSSTKRCCFCCSRSYVRLLRASVVVDEERAVDVDDRRDGRWINGDCFADDGGCAMVGNVDVFFW